MPPFDAALGEASDIVIGPRLRQALCVGQSGEPAGMIEYAPREEGLNGVVRLDSLLPGGQPIELYENVNRSPLGGRIKVSRPFDHV